MTDQNRVGEMTLGQLVQQAKDWDAVVSFAGCAGDGSPLWFVFAVAGEGVQDYIDAIDQVETGTGEDEVQFFPADGCSPECDCWVAATGKDEPPSAPGHATTRKRGR